MCSQEDQEGEMADIPPVAAVSEGRRSIGAAGAAGEGRRSTATQVR